ncbi:hypothetical protein E2C01_042575 [Portunus trituberculatus]|uniref:Uncharacterized protein n=1 Tax=Portunus trituberculatus TaxID=210409 RepID=A0A5B7FQL4_PORTR|nr:hypothetical protein [Portunus trituberculatus]
MTFSHPPSTHGTCHQLHDVLTLLNMAITSFTPHSFTVLQSSMDSSLKGTRQETYTKFKPAME